MEWNQILLIAAGVLAVFTVSLFFPQTQQNPEVLHDYTDELTDNTEILDVIIDVTEGTSREEVLEWLEDNYPDYEILELSQESPERYAVRLKKTKEESK